MSDFGGNPDSWNPLNVTEQPLFPDVGARDLTQETVNPCL